MSDNEKPLEWLSVALSRYGRSQAALARHLKLHPAAVSRMISGKREVKAREMVAIYDYLNSTDPDRPQAPGADRPTDAEKPSAMVVKNATAKVQFRYSDAATAVFKSLQEKNDLHLLDMYAAWTSYDLMVRILERLPNLSPEDAELCMSGSVPGARFNLAMLSLWASVLGIITEAIHEDIVQLHKMTRLWDDEVPPTEADLVVGYGLLLKVEEDLPLDTLRSLAAAHCSTILHLLATESVEQTLAMTQVMADRLRSRTPPG